MFWLFRIYLKQVKANIQDVNALAQLKYFLRWKRSLENGASSVKDEQPWITFETIDFLKKSINGQSNIFEYGGGGSTLFFLKRAKVVVTAEHNKEWFAILKEIILKKGYKNWEGKFIEAQKNNYIIHPDKANPDHYSSGDIDSKDHHYHNYVTTIDSYEDNFFDVILIDGRSRPSCLKHSIPKLKKGGLLVLDNSDRDYYLIFFKDILTTDFEIVIDNIGSSPYCREFTKTSIWKKK